ncbi:MAG: hypothetical protein OXE95_06590, partial [Chloroflexi bacterium]|nr:hypothetical protein [Chloroflexota bacterium]
MTNHASVAKIGKARAERPSRSFWRDVFGFILRDRLTVFAIGILLAATLVCSLSPIVLERVFGLEVNATNIPDRFKLPGEDGYALGTDQLGRDQ